MSTSDHKSRPIGPLAKAKRKRRARQPRLAGFIAMTFAIMVGGLLVLAGQTQVPQVTRAPGTIVPLGNYHQIESLEGGIVEVVHVGDGETVEAGTVLVELKNPELAREAEAIQKEIEALEAKLANNRAILNTLGSGEAIDPSYVRELADAGLAQASAQLQTYSESQSIKANSINQQRETNKILKQALAFAERRADRKEKGLAEARDLFERGLNTRRDLQAEEDRADALSAAASDAAVRLAQAENSLMISISERESETLALRESTLFQLLDLEAERASLLASQELVQSKLASLRLAAPERGVLQAVAYPNVGEVIEPGETLFELLPVTQSLIVEARIPNIDIGHVATAHPVAITVDTFDVRRFGKVDGVLASVSPVPLIDEQTGLPYFRASIELQEPLIGSGAFERPLTAGMTVVAEMITNEQTFLAYLIKPVQNTLDRAFSER